MEEPREQPAQPAPQRPDQPAPPPQPAQPGPDQSAYQAASASFTQPQPPPPYPGFAASQPASAGTGGRLLRLLARRAIPLGERAWALLAPRLGWVLLTGFLLGVIGILSMSIVLPRIFAARPEPADARVAALAPAPAVEDFLRGQQTYDADLMWASFSPELRANLEDRDITRDSLAERAESERQAGQRYSDFKYIGGLELDGRQRMYFYVVDISSPQQNGSISFVFTVGSDGKILSVE